MSTAVVVNTYAYSVAYVTDKLLLSIKNIIRLSGLDPAKFADDWALMERGVKRWLETEDLQEVTLEVYDPNTNAFVGRWDFEIYYGYLGDGSFWIDPDVIRYHIFKQGIIPGHCTYRLLATTKPGRPDVAGWARTTFRSTEGFVKQSIGTTIDGSGLSSGTSYWRKV
jgi:Bacterial HORMA domain 2